MSKKTYMRKVIDDTIGTVWRPVSREVYLRCAEKDRMCVQEVEPDTEEQVWEEEQRVKFEAEFKDLNLTAHTFHGAKCYTDPCVQMGWFGWRKGAKAMQESFL